MAIEKQNNKLFSTGDWVYAVIVSLLIILSAEYPYLAMVFALIFSVIFRIEATKFRKEATQLKQDIDKPRY